MTLAFYGGKAWASDAVWTQGATPSNPTMAIEADSATFGARVLFGADHPITEWGLAFDTFSADSNLGKLSVSSVTPSVFVGIPLAASEQMPAGVARPFAGFGVTFLQAAFNPKDGVETPHQPEAQAYGIGFDLHAGIAIHATRWVSVSPEYRYTVTSMSNEDAFAFRCHQLLLGLAIHVFPGS
jgi:hypothetical protein